MIVALKVIQYFSPSMFQSAYYNLGLRSYRDLIMYYWEMAIFDTIHQVQTSKIVPVDKLNFKDKKLQKKAQRYRPSPVLCVKRSLQRLKTYPLNFQETSFIDYGSGMGRVMIVAAEAGFKFVIGLELSSDLNDTCKKNIEQYVRKHPGNNFSILEQDATTFLPSNKTSVFFFFRPFDVSIHEQVMEKILMSLKQYPRTIYCLALQCDYDFLQYGMKKICFETGVTIYSNSSFSNFSNKYPNDFEKD